MEEKHLLYHPKRDKTVYKTYRNDIYEKKDNDGDDDDDDDCMVNVYALPNETWSYPDLYWDSVQKVKQTFNLMTISGLMRFHKLYYDKKRNVLLITMERLQDNLREYVERKKRKISEFECQYITYC